MYIHMLNMYESRFKNINSWTRLLRHFPILLRISYVGQEDYFPFTINCYIRYIHTYVCMCFGGRKNGENEWVRERKKVKEKEIKKRECERESKRSLEWKSEWESANESERERERDVLWLKRGGSFFTSWSLWHCVLFQKKSSMAEHKRLISPFSYFWVLSAFPNHILFC
jgi:hypothetical protein